LCERVILLDLIQQQNVLSGSDRILAKRADARAAGKFGGQLLLGRLGLVKGSR
jgi:hypothetical protein